MKSPLPLSTLISPLVLAAPAFGQLVADNFTSGNPSAWGIEFVSPATHLAAGGNPGGRIQMTIASSTSSLPAATVLPAAANHPWKGNFRTLAVSSFGYDRFVELGSSNFGTNVHLVLGHDGGTSNDFSDDAWVWVAAGDVFQFGMSPWTSITVPIPSSSPNLPASWGGFAFPTSPMSGSPLDAIWDFVISDVDYVGLAMNVPFNGGAWFGSHVISFDNFHLDSGAPLGTNYCTPAAVNSTGAPASISALGSASVALNSLSLACSGMPNNQFGFFLLSQTQGFVPGPGGSQGNLCLAGNIGRFNSVIQNSGSAGSISISVDLNALPLNPAVAALPGQTWHFQAWHRDLNPMATSNFSNGVSVLLQ